MKMCGHLLCQAHLPKHGLAAASAGVDSKGTQGGPLRCMSDGDRARRTAVVLRLDKVPTSDHDESAIQQETGR